MKKIFVGFAAFFSFTVIIFWIFAVRHKSHLVAYMGAGYALLCFGFLAAQIAAFIKAHTEYDDIVEQPKFDLFQMELAEEEA